MATKKTAEPASWSLPGTDECIVGGCATKPKAGPLCGKHAKYADEYGPETMPDLSTAGWAWVMDRAREVDPTSGDVIPFRLATLALSCHVAVSRADTETLLEVPGWARYRLSAPWVPDELIIALARHDRPDYDRNAVAWAAAELTLPMEAYQLLAADPERSIRMRTAQGVLPDSVRELLMDDRDDAVAAAAFGFDVARSMYHHRSYASAPLMTTPARVKRMQELAVHDGVEFTTLLRVEQLPSFEGMSPTGFRYREAVGYLAYACPSPVVFETAVTLLADGWADSLPTLVKVAAGA